MSNSANMSALEWFFRRQSGGAIRANFPQDTSSQESIQLVNAVKSLIAVLAKINNTSAKATELQSWVVAHEGLLDGNAKKTSFENLVRLLGEMLTHVTASDAAALDAIDRSKVVIVQLVILAKESQDTGFRQRIIDLAKKFTAVEQAAGNKISESSHQEIGDVVAG